MVQWYEYAIVGCILFGGGLAVSILMVKGINVITKDKNYELAHAMVQISLSFMLVIFGIAALVGAWCIVQAVIKLIH